ncbi:DsrE family protein [Granulosicoccaceae sp. 1_MG-2023]|nr:DsrE family protein [Granulosicoccaceae sp. 1_MG-2023]
MPERRFLLSLSRAPYGHLDGQEGLDLALVLAAFGQNVTVALLDDGVYHLTRGQDSSALGLKPYTRQLPALGDFDIRELIVDRAALQARGLSASQLQAVTHEDDDFNEHDSLLLLEGAALAEKLATFDIHFGF